MKSLGGLGVFAYVVYEVSGMAESILNGIKSIKFHRARTSVMSLNRRSGSPFGGVHNGRMNGAAMPWRTELRGRTAVMVGIKYLVRNPQGDAPGGL